jgi:hypothetical protein
MAATQIQYLPHHSIDKSKWDHCVRSVPGSLIYNYSWYLDGMAPQWDALVMNNYEAIMPLTWRKKYGIYYLYQPFFTAQTGITANTGDSSLTDAFIRSIPQHFKYADIDLNEKNDTGAYAASCRKRLNMLLDTRQDYTQLSKQYHRLATRILKKAVAEEVAVETGADIAGSIQFYQQHYKLNKILPDDYDHLTKTLQLAARKNQVISLAAKKNNKFLGVYLLLSDDHYVYSVIGGSSAEGKEKGAFYLLTDHAIRTVCGDGRQFRFEGSDLPGIANFNQQFGAVPFYYNHLQLNRLPFPLNLLKK